MASKTMTQQLLERNKAVAQTHSPVPYFAEFKDLGVSLPNVLVLTCADPRCSPEYYLNLKPDDGVIIMRNVCGHVTLALNDIIALDDLLTLKEVLIVHHTDCGALLLKEDVIRKNLKMMAPSGQQIDGMSFGAITNVEQSVKDDLNIFAASPFIRKELLDHTSGYVYDIKTGKLSLVHV